MPNDYTQLLEENKRIKKELNQAGKTITMLNSVIAKLHVEIDTYKENPLVRLLERIEEIEERLDND